MKISKDEALKQVIEALKELSENMDIKIDSNTNPIEVLSLDSGHGLPFACEMEDRLSIKIPVEINPFVEDKPFPHARTVGQIVDLLITISKGQGEE